jgi:hypothetical protein
MTQERYKTVGASTTTPVEMKRRREVQIPQVLTDYTLFYYYGDLDRTPVRNATFLATLSDGAVRQGTLDGQGRAQLCAVPKGPVNIVYQHDAPAEDSAEIVDARNAVRDALAAIVNQTRLDMADEWKEWEEANWLTKQYLLKVNDWQGQAVGAWQWLSGTVQTVWQLAVLLYKTDREIRELRGLILTGQWEQLDKKIAGYRAKGEKVLDAAGEVKELLILIFNDEPTRDLIKAFPAQWWAAIPPDERRELQASVGTQIAIDVVIAVLLAAFTAGAAGAVYGSTKWAERIGKLGGNLVRLLETLKKSFERLAKALKVRKRRITHAAARPNAAREIESKWTPPKNTPPKGGRHAYAVKRVPDDLVSDDRGVYGYVPKEGTQFAPPKWPVDWTDPAQVANAREVRLGYHDGLVAERDLVTSLRADGMDEESIARNIVDLRNETRISKYPADKVEMLYQRNLETYGNPKGPSYESLLAKYGSPQGVIEAGTRSNTTMDVLTGIATIE